MTTHIDAAPDPRRTGAQPAGRHDLLSCILLAALFVVALVVRHSVAANTDVSWLLTAGERVLDGKRLYADVIETNPPMAVLAYVPSLLVSRALHLPAEVVVDGFVFVAVAISLTIVGRILKRSTLLQSVNVRIFVLIAFAALTILPTQAFAQREHVALIALLPMLALSAMRARNETPDLWAVALGGLGAGLTLTFKPHFVLAVASGLLALSVTTRSWRLLFAPETFIAAAVAGVYMLGTVALFPEFFTVITPLVRDVYMPVGISLAELMQKPAVFIWAALLAGAILTKARSRIDAPFILLLATSCAFAIGFFLQRKGWPYHSYPMIALALLAFAYALASLPQQTVPDRAFSVCAVVILAALFIRAMLWFDWAFDGRPLEAPVAQLGPRPSILAITAEPGIGHPLTRTLAGKWVSRQQGLWVAAYVRRLRSAGPLDAQADSALEAYAARERAMLKEDIRNNPPTVVIVDNLTDDWRAWLKGDPELAALLKPFEAVENINGVEILKRRD